MHSRSHKKELSDERTLRERTLLALLVLSDLVHGVSSALALAEGATLLRDVHHCANTILFATQQLHRSARGKFDLQINKERKTKV